MMVLLSLPIIGYVILSNHAIQQTLIGKLSERLSTELKAEVSIRDIDIYSASRIRLYDLCIKVWGDTLLYSHELGLSIEDLDLKNGILHFGNCEMNYTYFNFVEDSTYYTNLDALVDPLLEGSSDTGSVSISFDQIKLLANRYHMSLYDSIETGGIDYRNVLVENIFAKITDLKVTSDFVMDISDLACSERCGFMVNKLNTRFTIKKGKILFDDSEITTPYSDVKAGKIYFLAESFSKYSEFLSKVNLDLQFKKSRINIRDLSFFAPPGLEHNTERFTIGGRFTGTVVNFKSNNFFLRYGDHTLIEGAGSVNGLPETMETYLYLDIRKMTTHYDDIQRIITSFSQDSTIIMPQLIRRLGLMKYYGVYTGFLNDFVAYGNLDTELGGLSTDIMIKPQGKQNLMFQGNLMATAFNIGALVDYPMLGMVDLSARIDGANAGDDHSFTASIDGLVNYLQFNNYSYQAIMLKGDLSRRSFNGLVSIDDPNIKFNFSGSLDFSKNISEHHFYLDLENANLYKLNFERKDSSFAFGCNLVADFKGNNIDSLNGIITVHNAGFKKKGKQYNISNAILSVASSSDSSAREEIELSSELVDLKIEGRYDFRTIVPTFNTMIHQYLPSLLPSSDSTFQEESDCLLYTSLPIYHVFVSLLFLLLHPQPE